MADKMKAITEDCLVFYDHRQKVGVNVIPLDKFRFLPEWESIYIYPVWTVKAKAPTRSLPFNTTTGKPLTSCHVGMWRC